MVVIGYASANVCILYFISLIVNRHLISLFTARKRSLGQGNIFKPVCHSVHRGGTWSWGVPGPGRVSALGDVCSSRGACSQGGAWWRPPGRLLLRAVRILLECTLVLKKKWRT